MHCTAFLPACWEPKLNALFLFEDFPARLCHYTDFAGLKGILETGRLWATYGKTLNDSTEHKYGQERLAQYLQSKVRPEAQHFVETGLNNPRRNFVSCFCESSQVLSMWRSYAAFGGGYCLEFNGPSLLSCNFPPIGPRMPFKITYGNDMSQPLQDVLDILCEFGGRGQVEAVLSGSWLSIFALKFKHPAFAEEREWRLVIQDPEASHLRFRAGHANIRPYIELSPVMTDGSTKRFPLQKVFYGPTLRDDEVLVETIQMMLQQFGYGNVPVEPSGIPYRI